MFSSHLYLDEDEQDPEDCFSEEDVIFDIGPKEFNLEEEEFTEYAAYEKSSLQPMTK